jgi:hypothetical protein
VKGTGIRGDVPRKCAASLDFESDTMFLFGIDQLLGHEQAQKQRRGCGFSVAIKLLVVLLSGLQLGRGS